LVCATEVTTSEEIVAFARELAGVTAIMAAASGEPVEATTVGAAS
jgi:hypothetical protein